MFACLIVRCEKAGIVILLRGASNSAEKRCVIQKKFRREHASLR